MSRQASTQPLPEGVVVPLATPITADETLDAAAMEQLVALQLEAGVNSLFVLGSVGEGSMLTDPVRRETVRRTVALAGGKVPVYAAAMDNSVKRVVERLVEVAEAGADAGVFTLPFYGWPDYAEGALEFCLAAADQSPIPVIVYNLPKVAGVSMDLDTIKGMFEHPKIIGLKDTRADLEGMRAVAACEGRPGKLSHLIGNSGLACELMRAGAEGVVSTLANIYPGLLVKARDACRAGDQEAMDRCTALLTHLSAIMAAPSTPGGIKCGMELRGIGTCHTVRPWPVVKPGHIETIKGLMAKAESDMTGMGITI